MEIEKTSQQRKGGKKENIALSCSLCSQRSRIPQIVLVLMQANRQCTSDCVGFYVVQSPVYFWLCWSLCSPTSSVFGFVFPFLGFLLWPPLVWKVRKEAKESNVRGKNKKCSSMITASDQSGKWSTKLVGNWQTNWREQERVLSR